MKIWKIGKIRKEAATWKNWELDVTPYLFINNADKVVMVKKLKQVVLKTFRFQLSSKLAHALSFTSAFLTELF